MVPTCVPCMWTFHHYKRHYLRIFRWKLAGNADWVDCKPVYSLEAGQSPEGAKYHHIRTRIGLTCQRRRVLSFNGMRKGQKNGRSFQTTLADIELSAAVGLLNARFRATASPPQPGTLGANWKVCEWGGLAVKSWSALGLRMKKAAVYLLAEILPISEKD